MRPFTRTWPLVGAVTRLKDFEQGAFPGAIAANDAQHLALLNGKIHILQRPDGFAIPVAMVFLANLEHGIGLAAHFGPPDIDVAA